MFAECIQGSLSFLIPDEEAQARGGARGGAPEREALSPRAPTLEPCEFPGEVGLMIGCCRFVCTFPGRAHIGMG